MPTPVSPRTLLLAAVIAASFGAHAAQPATPFKMRVPVGPSRPWRPPQTSRSRATAR